MVIWQEDPHFCRDMESRCSVTHSLALEPAHIKQHCITAQERGLLWHYAQLNFHLSHDKSDLRRACPLPFEDPDRQLGPLFEMMWNCRNANGLTEEPDLICMDSSRLTSLHKYVWLHQLGMRRASISKKWRILDEQTYRSPLFQTRWLIRYSEEPRNTVNCPKAETGQAQARSHTHAMRLFVIEKSFDLQIGQAVNPTLCLLKAGD